MKALVLILILLSWLGSHAQYAVQPDTIKPLYTDKHLESFLDSIGHLSSSEEWVEKATAYPDSFFKNQQQVKWSINDNDFEKLKTACRTRQIDTTLAKIIFKDLQIDSSKHYGDSMDITFFPFDKDSFDFNNYAICIGSPNALEYCELYFFKSNVCISKHIILHHYGLELNHYIDTDGKTIVYYKFIYTHGSGIWWFNFYFYKYYNNQLLPVLDELQNANLNGWNKHNLWLESTVVKTNPLTLKMLYNQQLIDYNGIPSTIINDSTLVTYSWNETSKSLKGNYVNSKISKEQILSYYLTANDLHFIHAYYKVLKAALNNPIKHRAVALYLSEVKEQYNHSEK